MIQTCVALICLQGIVITDNLKIKRRSKFLKLSIAPTYITQQITYPFDYKIELVAELL